MRTVPNDSTVVNLDERRPRRPAAYRRVPGDADVRLDFDGNYAEVWARRPGLIYRLKCLGLLEIQRQGRGYGSRGHVRQFWKPVTAQRIGARRGNPAGLAKARELRRVQRAVRQETPA